MGIPSTLQFLQILSIWCAFGIFSMGLGLGIYYLFEWVGKWANKRKNNEKIIV